MRFIFVTLFFIFNLTYATTGIQNNLAPQAKIESLNSIQNIKAELKNPQESFRTFLMAMNRVKKGETEAILVALTTIDLSEIDMGSRNTIGRLTAERIVNTIDRLSKVNLSQIPTEEDGPVWYYKKQSINNDNGMQDVEIAFHKTAEGWKFTPKTVSTIEIFYNSVSSLKVVEGVVELKSWKNHFKEKMPHWTGEEIFLMKNGQWIGLFVVILFSLFMLYSIRFIANYYARNNVKKENRYKSTLPFGLLAFSFAFKFGIYFLEFDIDILETLFRLDYVLTAISAVWASLQVVDYISFQFERKAHLSKNKFDDVLIPMIKKATKVVVVAFGGLFVAHSLTFDVASILAGLGIGGVAVALAAKDTISNLFGSVTVILDRPFNIGDYVVLEKGIEGTIEQVGFRSTRIRTPINSLVTLPNSVLANIAIDNYGMRSYRRFKTILQVEYSASNTEIETFVIKLRQLVSNTDSIAHKEMESSVYIYDLGESSINILFNVYFKVNSAGLEFQERHKLLVKILELAKENKINFAYPTRTLFLNNN